MVLHLKRCQEPEEKDLDKVRHLAVDNMAHHQDSHQVGAQGSPLPMASKDQLHAIHQAKKGIGLAQGVLVPPNNMSLAQKGLMALFNMDLDIVTLLLVGSSLLRLDSHVPVVTMYLALVLHLAVGNVVHHPDKYHFPGLPIVVQVSRLPVISICLLRGSPLAMTTRGLDHIILPPLVVMGIPVEILPTLASMYLAQ